MSLALLFPLGLLALAALLVPLLLHLARRSEQRITDFAALRWLASQPRPRRKRRFDERLLLLLRLLLLVALALLLAQPVLYGAADRTPWVVAAPGVPAAAARAAVADAGRVRMHWLAPGFPGLDAPAPQGSQPLSSLLRELDATLPAGTRITVLVPGVIDGVDAQRPRLGREVDWRVIAGGQKAPARTQPMDTRPPVLEVRAAADAAGLRYLRAVGAAAPPVRIATPGEALPAGARALAWLVPGPLPDAIREWVRGGGRVLLSDDARAAELEHADVLWMDAHGDALVRGTALGRGRLMQITRPLAPAAMPQLLEADFPRQLRALFADPAPAPARVSARDHAPVAGAAAPWPQPARPLDTWLMLLIGLLFLLERWVASGPRRGAGA